MNIFLSLVPRTRMLIIHASNVLERTAGSPLLPVRPGRPDLHRVVADVSAGRDGQGWLLACGPPPLVHDAERVAGLHGLGFSAEAFLF